MDSKIININDQHDADDDDEVALQHYCESHGWSELTDAVDARLVLSSKCVLICDKILKELISMDSNDQNKNHNQSISNNHKSGSGVGVGGLNDMELDDRQKNSQKISLAQNLNSSLGDLGSSIFEMKIILKRLQKIYDQNTTDTNKNNNNGYNNDSSALEKSKQKISKNRLIKAFNELQKSFKSIIKRATPILSSFGLSPSRSSKKNSNSSGPSNKKKFPEYFHPQQDPDSEKSQLTQGTLYNYQSGWTLAEESAIVDDLTYQTTERNDFIKEIERDVTAVHAMFMDLNGLVHEQQYFIDSIESSIMETKMKSESAHSQLRIAEKHQQSKRRSQCCWICIMMSATLIVLLMLYILLK